MVFYILIALLNGIFISMSRVLIGRLSIEIGSFKASFWSYIVGFIFTTLILVIIGNLDFHFPHQTPLFAYMGGLFGAIYVVINSYVFTRIGAIKTVLLIISGQMISGIFIDYKNGTIDSAWIQCLGVILILLGVYLTKLSSLRYEASHKKI